MASKRSKNAPPADDLDELFEGIGDETTAPKKTTKTKGPVGAKKTGPGGPGKDILAELENELEDKPISRPHTPRIKEIAASSTSRASPARRAAAGTPPPDAASLPRRSADSAKSALAAEVVHDHAPELMSTSASAPTAAPAAGGGGSGWWGGLLSTASAAMKQAEAAVKEIQQNEEAKKWAEQVRGNYSALRGYGDELRHRALPTFTDILHTLAPPIASHERLLIHITHDMVGYPSLDPLVHGAFSRVMAQVEGGDLMVIQRGQESAVRTSSSASERNPGSTGNGTAGWRDGPWWRAVDSPRDLGAVPGLHEGTKLCRASAEAYAKEYHAATGGLDEARHRAVEPMSESNPVRRSDLFLAVQAILTTAAAAGSDSNTEPLFSGFAVYVLDPVHEIVFSTVSQEFPSKWTRWLEAPAALTPASSSVDDGTAAATAVSGGDDYERVPEDIRAIIESGGVDPREWVAEWVEEALTLAVGVVAQRYVARRMGVGLGSIGKGKRRMDAVIADGGGEAARAGLI
ncbi:hypothetical protein CMQ_545 [Grosmannia clavigera kw1407]|uniref:Maintenance of telomere capping protein 1 n=1 Tax=Grosmannia clavigera (strain kw1407 / UAMH 11150) TaxID=655863 RepID=F0XCK0_GROCL|nr:uncharacterized protein CMQ_545 [Grosmannia clavigera kw1407]EFX03617.1 hypothetical protein CMQ_545 [Grosmannia clavigera kw1407]